MANKKSTGKKPQEVTIDYIKGNFFRVIHADGVWGGLTPRAQIHMDFWTERHPIPQTLVYRLNDQGGLGDEIKDARKERSTILREVEAGVVMELDVAINFRDWLNDKIAAAERLREDARRKRKSTGKKMAKRRGKANGDAGR